ncbi:Uncharacterised protein [Mycobacteroides abscessus]|nr:Uncharacterised protein [Mycobacteroides abscessus]
MWPFWRPYPLASLTVMPRTPAASSADFTSSSRCGWMIPVTSFMPAPP